MPIPLLPVERTHPAHGRHQPTPPPPAAHATLRIPRAEAESMFDKSWVAIVEGRPHALPSGRPQTFGSGPGCHVRLFDRHASRHHCTLTRRGPEVWVEDLDSTNGVRVRGVDTSRARVDDVGLVQVGRLPVLIAQQVGRRVPDALAWQGMIGRDPETLALWSRLAHAALSDAPVWLHGETGTGKERAAHALHCASPRRSRGPWVAVNCAALPHDLAEAELFGVTRGAFTGAHKSRPGAFVQADGGTLLLDEVGELPLTIQAKLLRVLETGEVQPVGADGPVRVDVRIVAATWRDLELAADEGSFRPDLLHRLWVLRIEVPPLRKRLRDVAALLDELLGEAQTPHLWPERALMLALETSAWPGNIRQLRNHVRRAITADSPIPLVPDTSPRGIHQLRPRDPRGLAERPIGVVAATVRAYDGNRSAAARALGISRSTLYRWLDAARPPR